jgi:hypothetical protein
MAQANPFEEQVQANLPKLEERPEFAAELLWLTFYLMGSPENLRQVSKALKARGWVNVDGWEGAFLYPKVQVQKSTAGVVEAAEAARALCARHGIEILEIDADTSRDVVRSRGAAAAMMPRRCPRWRWLPGPDSNRRPFD